MSDDTRIICTYKKNGYAETLCDGLARSLNDHGSRSGLTSHAIWNIALFESIGDQIILKSGEFKKKGILLNCCPFCQGQLYDPDYVKGEVDE